MCAYVQTFMSLIFEVAYLSWGVKEGDISHSHSRLKKYTRPCMPLLPLGLLSKGHWGASLHRIKVMSHLCVNGAGLASPQVDGEGETLCSRVPVLCSPSVFLLFSWFLFQPSVPPTHHNLQCSSH